MAHLKALQRTQLKVLARELTAHAISIGKWSFIAAIAPISQGELEELAEEIQILSPQSGVLLASKEKERCQLLAKIPPDLVRAGLSAQELIRDIAHVIEGSGGGKPERAIAGGKNPARMEAALDLAKQWISSRV